MTGSQKVILLACGSYNPPTNMHLRMFEIARDYLHKNTNCQVIAGLVSPVHDKYGKDGLALSNDRCQMVRLAVSSSSWIHLSDWETRQEEWTPTRHVLQHHQDLLDSIANGNVDNAKRQRLESPIAWMNQLSQTLTVPGRNLPESVRVKLLCGADLLESFGKPGVWKDEDIEAIVGKYGLVVVTREGSNPYKFIYESDTLSRLQRNIHVVTEWISNEISSTKVRRCLRRGESVKYLLQDPVIDYIHKHVLFDTHNNSKYTHIPSMLTPSPNPDTDVLMPPPNFNLHNQRNFQYTHQTHLTATLTRQHARQNSTPSDMEQETPPGLSPANDLSPLTNHHNTRLYPGQARPVKQRSSEVGVERNAALQKRDNTALTATHLGVDRLLESTKKELSAIASSKNVEFKTSVKNSKNHSLMQSKNDSTPTLLKSHSVSPKKGSPLPEIATRKILTNHNRSKSSISLKPDRNYDFESNHRHPGDFVRFRENYTRSLSTGSNIHELLARTRQISPSHTEMCLTHVPSRHHDKPIVARSRNGDRLFTSRSLERPCTPRMDRSLSPPRKITSLPISRGRSRERSPSPYLTEMRNNNEPYLGTKRDSLDNYDDLEYELRNLPRTLTHEEEINMIISGESANYMRMATPDSFPVIDGQSSESIVSNEDEYEMRF